MTMQDQFIPNPEDQLEDALAMLAAGIPLAEILADAGEDADWLRPFLEMAVEVKELRPAIKIPSPDASLQRMLAHGQKLAADSPPPGASSNWSILLENLLSGVWLPRLAAGMVSALLVVVLLGGTLMVLAQRSLPGQPLYGLKRAAETLRLNLTTDPEQRAQLIKNYNEYRQTEAKLLLEQNQVATVTFLCYIERMTGSSLTLDGQVVQLTPQTKVTGPLAVGARVEVDVLTQPPDQLLALAVTVVEPAPPAPTPLPSPTATLTPEPSPTPPAATPTATGTRSLTSDTDTLQLPTFTPTATPTNLPTYTPTVPPPPPPTATPLPHPAPPPASPLIPPTAVDDGGNTNDNGSEGVNNNDNTNSNNNADDSGNDSGHDDSGSSSSGSGGGGNSGSGSSGHGGDDKSSE